MKDKVFLVSGASQGLGFAIASQLLNAGAKIAIASSNQEKISAAETSLNADENCLSSVCDVRDAGAIKTWVKEVYEHFGRIDGLVTNAGGPPPGMFDDFDDAIWQGAFELTLMSVVRMVREVMPYLRNQQSGSILMLTSSSVKEPIDILLLSNVFRSGVASLAKSLATAEAKNGIRVNSLIPGLIDTGRLKPLAEFKAKTTGLDVEAQMQQMVSNIPMGRLGEPDEFAKTAVFLLSEAASYITGSSLVVDGGALRVV